MCFACALQGSGSVPGAGRLHPGERAWYVRRPRAFEGSRMAVRRIVKFGDPVLSTPTALVTDITAEVRDLVRDMIETMYAAPGVGLAANQVGVSLRVAVIDVTAGQEPGRAIVLINPQVVEQEGRQIEEEGCLSIPGYTEFVHRPARAVVRALDIEGR